MGVFEFLAISMVALCTSSVIKSWFKYGRHSNRERLLNMQERIQLLEGQRLDRRLDVVEDIVTGSNLDHEFGKLEQAQRPRLLG